MSNKYLDYIALNSYEHHEKVASTAGITPDGRLTIEVSRPYGHSKTYIAEDYLKNIKPSTEAKEAAKKSAIVGSSTALAFSALAKGSLKDKAIDLLKGMAIGGTVSSGMTGLLTYQQARQRGIEQYDYLKQLNGEKK